MGDVRTTDGQAQSEEERRQEWDRLSEGESGQPATDPAKPAPADEPASGATGQADTGTPAKDPDPARAAEKPANQNDELWANADPALREAFEAEREARTRAENTIRTHEGRLTATQRQLLEAQARIPKVEPTKQEEAKPVLTDEVKAQLREDFPDVASPLLDAISALETEQANLRARDASREEQEQAARAVEAQRFFAEQEQKLATAYPDWHATCRSAPFIEWAQKQPQIILDGLQRNADAIVDADSGIKILDLYRAEVAPDDTAQRRQRQLDATRNIDTKNPQATSSQTQDRDAEWARLDALDRAKNR